MTHDYSFHPLGPARRSGHPGWSEVCEGLLIGEYPLPADAEWLAAELGVSAVINLQDEYDLVAKGLRIDELERVYAAHGIVLHHVPVVDGDIDSLCGCFDRVVGLLRAAAEDGRRVYLHCNAGINRAPTVAIAYLHAAHGVPLEQAIAAVHHRRPCLPYAKALQQQYGST
ncbi:MAG TPA: dual specificity protein phosphatase family protein [Terriglobales bacterium]|nr:dual specificity protein phosphatase family protein [Terriglobales bacterium]